MNFCRWFIYKWSGWKKDVTVEHPKKCVICLAPHTSNKDFIIGQMYAKAEKLKICFLMKKEWFFWPLGPILRKMGGVAILRSEQEGMTDYLSQRAIEEDVFHLCVTPEGTRSLNPEWKSGFYYIALKAKLPIMLYGLDYKRRLIQCNKILTPTGDFEKDMLEIKQYYKDFTGLHPERFTTGD